MFACCQLVQRNMVDIMTINYSTLPDEALLRQVEICRPGPVPMARTAWKEKVAAGLAPQPVIRKHRSVLWRWGDVRKWLADQGAQPDEAGE